MREPCPEMTALEIAKQGWTYRSGMMIKKDGETPVFFADIVDVHAPTRSWVELRMRKTASLDDFEMGG